MLSAITEVFTAASASTVEKQGIQLREGCWKNLPQRI